MRWLPCLLAWICALGCAVPERRDCFETYGRKTVQSTPPPPPLTAPPASVADIATLEVIASGLDEPVALAQPPGESERLFVAERKGRILVLRPGAQPEVAADLSAWVATEHREQGLLSLAFHPGPKAGSAPEPGDGAAAPAAGGQRLYVSFTARADGALHVVELRMDARGINRVDPSSPRQLLRIGQPFPEHNGGHLVFGPDGLLYVGTGDGGGRGDPRGHAQTCSSWRGKMLRIDVDAPTLAVEVIQVGLRHPWRFSFDRQTGDLYLADVGEDAWELIFALPATKLKGHNFGWNIASGSRCFGKPDCDRSGFTAPVLEYDHNSGCAVIGGHVYRGRALPELEGLYFFADHCSGLVRSVRWNGSSLGEYWDWRPVLDPTTQLRRITSFAEDRAGELYLLSLTGTIWKLARK